MIISWLGIIIILFGIMSLYTVYRTDEDELPVPKEYLYKSAIMIILIGLAVYESGKLSRQLEEFYLQPTQNFIKL